MMLKRLARNAVPGLNLRRDAVAAGLATNSITIRVTDNGTPPLSAIATFSVSVYPCPNSALSGRLAPTSRFPSAA